MAKKKERSKIDPNAWMNTYSDMVTLLMCFFVLLYASSTPDATKWQYIFQSFTSSGTYVNPFVLEEQERYDNDASEEDGVQMEPTDTDSSQTDDNIVGNELPENFDDAIQWFSATASSSEFSDSISVEMSSSGTITIRFRDGIMFAPNSAELLSSGRRAISQFLPGIRAISEYIAKINVSGHTTPGVVVSSVNDWDLSAARACSVVKYMDFQVVVDSSSYLARGYAQYDPISDASTEEGRAENRRVEIQLVRNSNKIEDNAIIEDILKYDYGIGEGSVGGGGTSNSDAVSQIIGKLEEKYDTTIDSSGTVIGDESGPGIIGNITGIPDSVIHELDEEGNIITSDEEQAPEESEETESETSE